MRIHYSNYVAKDLLFVKERFILKKEKKVTVDQIYEDMLSAEDGEKSQKDNMIKYYMSQTEATETEAEEVVNGIISGVTTFSDKFEEFRSDRQGAKANLMNSLRAALENASLEEQYELLRDILYVLHAVSMETMGNLSKEVTSQEERLTSIKMPIVEGVDLSQGLIDELLEQVVQGIDACGYVGLLNVFSSNQEETNDPENFKAFFEEEKMTGLISNEWNITKVKNYAALATYMLYQRGDIPELPKGLNSEEIGVMTAAEIERGRAYHEAEQGLNAWDVTMQILSTITLVAATCLVAYASISILAGYLTVAIMAPTITLSLLFAGLGYLTYRGMKSIAGNVVNGIEEISNLIVVPAEYIKRAVKKVGNWARNTASWIHGKFARSQNSQEEPETNSVNA